jgi:3-dehydroquinate synthetase
MTTVKFSGLDILVLEDEPMLRKRVTSVLEGLGAEVSAAESVEAARQLIRSIEFDVALLDVNLPDGLGTDLLRGKCFPADTVVAIGGGAHLDVVGFAAATAHRGIRLVRVPTTSLAQADSAVGVKNGINAFGKKNFLGTFVPPHTVIVDSLFLSSLPARELRCGFAEAVKVALIRDARLFEWIEANADSLAQGDLSLAERLIHRSAELHFDHITAAGDPFEAGSSRPLDFGHWAAHKLESLSNYSLRHGEAVAVGIALDSIYSARCGLLDVTSVGRVLALLQRLGFSLENDLLDCKDTEGQLRLLEGVEEFREHLGGKLSVTLLAGIGQGIQVSDMDDAEILTSIEQLRERERTQSAREAPAKSPDDENKCLSQAEKSFVDCCRPQFQTLFLKTERRRERNSEHSLSK